MNLELRIRKNVSKSSSIKHKSLWGFTLIELLVVIVIMGVLSAVLFANFVGVRQRARDAQRKSDLRQIQAALELYKTDIGSYPVSLYPANCPTSGSLISGTVTYMQKISCNPKGLGGATSPSNGNYVYTSVGGTMYALEICLENRNDTGPDTVETDEVLCTGSGTALEKYRKYVLVQP